MAKRVFTKWLGGGALIQASTAVWANEVTQFTAQEPLTLIGAHLEAFPSAWSENDGEATVDLELSFSSTARMDVAILSVATGNTWNTAPAGVAMFSGNQLLMLPAGYGLSMKEGETVFLNIKEFASKSAGMDIFIVNAHLYYVKGAPTIK